MHNAWTDRELERNLAWRKRSDGSIVAIEICSECKAGYPREDRKLGYGSGRALCFNCYQIGPAATVTIRDEVLAALTINQGHLASVLSRKLRRRTSEVSEALKQLELDGKARLANGLWFSVEVA